MKCESCSTNTALNWGNSETILCEKCASITDTTSLIKKTNIGKLDSTNYTTSQQFFDFLFTVIIISSALLILVGLYQFILQLGDYLESGIWTPTTFLSTIENIFNIEEKFPWLYNPNSMYGLHQVIWWFLNLNTLIASILLFIVIYALLIPINLLLERMGV